MFPQTIQISVAGGSPDYAAVVGGGGKANLLLKRQSLNTFLSTLPFFIIGAVGGIQQPQKHSHVYHLPLFFLQARNAYAARRGIIGRVKPELILPGKAASHPGLFHLLNKGGLHLEQAD